MRLVPVLKLATNIESLCRYVIPLPQVLAHQGARCHNPALPFDSPVNTISLVDRQFLADSVEKVRFGFQGKKVSA